MRQVCVKNLAISLIAPCFFFSGHLLTTEVTILVIVGLKTQSCKSNFKIWKSLKQNNRFL